jgi:hypothetical protein
MIYAKNLTFMLCLCAGLLAAPPSTYAVKPSDKPPPSEDVEKALARLQGLLERLHGYQVLYYQDAWGGSTSGDVFIEARVRLLFCLEEELLPFADCDESAAGTIILDTGFFDTSSAQILFTFDEDNSPDFEEIVERLTDGYGFDQVRTEDEFYGDSVFLGGETSSNSESGWAKVSTPIAPSVGDIDFQGLEIGSISVRITRLFSSYNSVADVTQYSLDYEVFFEMANLIAIRPFFLSGLPATVRGFSLP